VRPRAYCETSNKEYDEKMRKNFANVR